MGTYVNPGNSGFARILESDYVDKTGLIALMNERIGRNDSLVCISRPRRFGKSYAAKMLTAYYDCSCDSHMLFDDRDIAGTKEYRKFLNQFYVINLDITGFISDAKTQNRSLRDVPVMIQNAIRKDLAAQGFEQEEDDSLNDYILRCVESKDGRPFIFIIDEWDAMIREAKNDQIAQEAYLNLLRGWFKNNNFTPKAVAAAYMTGILPIKKDGSQSAISDFKEYSIIEPLDFARYFGFTEEEVRNICEEHHLNFDKVRVWYDGYTVGEMRSIYNPYSVMCAAETHRFRSYWKKTSAAEALMTYIDMDQEGLQDVIARLIAGETVDVDTDSFRNDVETFTCKDDVLTLLIHLGYLTYEEVSDSYNEDDEGVAGLAKIPNEEISLEFEKILRKATHKDLIALVRRSDQLLQDTLDGNCEAVAAAFQEVRDTNYAPTFYNDEQGLRSTVKMAYISCVDQYAKVEELPSGHGMADIVFFPKRRSALPAMVIELKWNQTADGAIRQIKDRNYPKVFENYGGKIVLVGVNYDEKTKVHTCQIETYDISSSEAKQAQTQYP